MTEGESFLTRSSGLFDLQRTKVKIVGAGGIGSWTTTILAKMGAMVEVYDFDKVEVVNVGTQLFSNSDIGNPKAIALAERANRHSDGGRVIGQDHRVVREDGPELYDCDILITALDSIEVRQEIWPVLREAAWNYFLDLRMGAELFTAYVIQNKDDSIRYENMLNTINPEDIPSVACTMKATAYTGAFAGGWAAVIIRRLLMGKKVPFIVSHNIIDVSINTMR